MGADGAAGRLVALAGGVFLQGGEDADAMPGDGEGPVRAVRLAPFAMAPHAVTNERFARFIRVTGHRTQAERSGWSFVFSAFVGPQAARAARGAASAAPWWWAVEGACWRAPEGPGSAVGRRAHHPVVHVARQHRRQRRLPPRRHPWPAEPGSGRTHGALIAAARPGDTG